MALRTEQGQVVQSVRAALGYGLSVVDLVSFEQVAAHVASVVLALLELVARFVVQHVSRAHEEPLHELMAQHAGGFSKVVEFDASLLGTLAEGQELLMAVRHPLDGFE